MWKIFITLPKAICMYGFFFYWVGWAWWEFAWIPCEKNLLFQKCAQEKITQ